MIIFLAYRLHWYFNVLQSSAVDSQFYSNLCWTLYNFYPRGTHHLKDNTQVLVLWFWNLTAWTVLNCDMSDNDWSSTQCATSWVQELRGLPLEMFCCPVLRFIFKSWSLFENHVKFNHWSKNAQNVGISWLPMQFTGNNNSAFCIREPPLNIFIW